jgi:hypothetical protein
VTININIDEFNLNKKETIMPTLPVTYSKTGPTLATNNVAIYSRTSTTTVAHGVVDKPLGSVSIDAKISNSTDYAATYVWSVRTLDSGGAETWMPITNSFSATDSKGNFKINSQAISASKIKLNFQAANTATTWESYTADPTDTLPLLGSDATIKVDISWADTKGAGFSNSLTKKFRFEFPVEMQSEDPSWTFDIIDETNSMTLE